MTTAGEGSAGMRGTANGMLQHAAEGCGASQDDCRHAGKGISLKQGFAPSCAFVESDLTRQGRRGCCSLARLVGCWSGPGTYHDVIPDAHVRHGADLEHDGVPTPHNDGRACGKADACTTPAARSAAARLYGEHRLAVQIGYIVMHEKASCILFGVINCKVKCQSRSSTTRQPAHVPPLTKKLQVSCAQGHVVLQGARNAPGTQAAHTAIGSRGRLWPAVNMAIPLKVPAA